MVGRVIRHSGKSGKQVSSSGKHIASASRGGLAQRERESSPRQAEHAADLEARVDQIKDGWSERRHRDRNRKRQDYTFDSPSGYLKREVYRLARALYKEHKRTRTIVGLLGEACGRRQRSPESQRAVFLGLLKLVASDDELTRSERHRYADELAYAERHRVPPQLLVGFILQTGPALRDAVKDEASRESWFDEKKHQKDTFKH